MAGNHTPAWHTAKQAVRAAELAQDHAVKHFSAAKVREAAAALKTAQDTFAAIDRDPQQAFGA